MSRKQPRFGGEAPRTRKPRTPHQRARNWAMTFAAVVVALAVAAVLFSLGSVRVVITATAVPVTADFDVAVMSGGAPQEQGLIGRLVAVDGTASVERILTERGDTPNLVALAPAKATGIVTIVNAHTVDQPLVATTRLLSPDGVLFRLDTAVTVPARGERADVPVTADRAGIHGNVGPTRWRIPGLSKWLQERIVATSTQPMRGGQGPANGGTVPREPAAVVREEDVAAMRQEVEDLAMRDLARRAETLASAAEEAFLIGEDVAVIVNGVVGDARKVLMATGTASARALVVPRGALRERAHAALVDAAAVQGRALASVDADALRLRIAAEDAAVGRVTIAIHAEGVARIAPTFSSFDAQRITGFTPVEVQTYLRSIPGVTDVEVTLWPSWVRSVPSNGKVEVEVREIPGVE